MKREHGGKATWWRPAVRVLGVVAVLSALLPSAFYQGGSIRTEAERVFVTRNPDAMPFRSDYTLGWPSSPMVHWFRESMLTQGIVGVAVRKSSGLNIHLLSWSSASLVVGAFLLWATRKRRAETDRTLDAKQSTVANSAMQ